MSSSHLRRRLPAVLGATAVVAALATAAPATSSAAPATSSAAPATSSAAPAAAPAPLAARSDCPAAYPVKGVHAGMNATGYTTSRGHTPQPFAAKVLGVYKDGISPGIDLIVIRAHSPAIKRAGGVWAGMSGSPIYAPDGRLLGALSYSFSGGPSNTAGVTPASAMYRLFRIGARSRTAAAASHIGFDAQTRSQLVGSGAATPEQAAGGMRFIPTPISVSGVPAGGFASVRKRMSKIVHGPFQLEAGGTVAPNRTAPVSRMRAGAPFVSSISTGDVTMAGIGTTTAVCHGHALAFGHPMLGGGATQMTAHTGDVLYIQSDPTFSPFVMANVGGRTGVVNQDRLTGLRARLGAEPKHLTKIITHISASTGMHRTARSWTALTGWVPDTAANAVYGSIATTFEKFGKGSGKFAYSIVGRRAGGKAFRLRRSDYVASTYDVGYEAANDLYNPLSRLVYNPYRHVHIHRVVATVHVTDAFREWSVERIQVRQHGRFVKPRSVSVRPGQLLHTRVELQQVNAIKPVRYVRFAVRVPHDARRFGFISARGGSRDEFFGGGGGIVIGPGGGSGGGGSFNKLLHHLQHAPRNASLSFVSQFLTRHGVQRVAHTVRLTRATTGGVGFEVRIGQGGGGGKA